MAPFGRFDRKLDGSAEERLLLLPLPCSGGGGGGGCSGSGGSGSLPLASPGSLTSTALAHPNTSRTWPEGPSPSPPSPFPNLCPPAPPLSPSPSPGFAAQLSPRVSDSFGVTPNAMFDFLITEDMLKEDMLIDSQGDQISPLKHAEADFGILSPGQSLTPHLG